ncbi:DNase I-like protein [Rhizophagus irregularis]|nr:DNase I-like protein [Rhizophagus irregularis]
MDNKNNNIGDPIQIHIINSPLTTIEKRKNDDPVHIQNYKKRIKKQKFKNNNNNNEKSNLYSIDDQVNLENNKKVFFNIATLNIRGLNQLKLINIYNILKKCNLDFLALTETKIGIKSVRFMAKELGITEKYVIQGTIDNNKQNSTGIVLFIKKQIANNISDIQVQLGRIVKIDFEFSKYNKFSIISIYNKSGNCKQAREEQQTVSQLVINMIKIARRNQQKIMVLGDFNLNFGKYEKLKNRNVRIDNQFSIFKYLENHNFVDAHKSLLNINDQQLKESHSTFKNSITFSRIDYIWLSENLDNILVNAKIIQDDCDNTDHKLLLVKLDRKELFPQPSLLNKTIQSFRIKYDYNKLTNENKEHIKDITKAELDERIKNFTPTCIEEKWSIYNHVISVIKKKEIEYTEIRIANERADEELKNNIIYRGPRISPKQKMLNSLEIKGSFYLASYNFNSLLQAAYIKEAEEMFNIAQINLNTELIKRKETKINEAIEKRQQDLEFDKKRMIDNVIEREFKKIYIDRVIAKDDEEDDILITEENEIKKVVAKHFQNCAGSTNSFKEIPQDWIEEYQPKEYISPSIYDSILKPISIEELLKTAKMLPRGKATGPSGMTYEDIKLTIEPLKELIQDIFNEILETGNLPKDWLRAHIYPIPKPKPWRYDLNNT